MNHKQVKHIVCQFHKELNKHYQKSIKDFDMEALHQLRLTYKKLRAFLRMTSYREEGGAEITIAKKMKKAYRIAGLIRDIQLQQQRIAEVAGQFGFQPKAYARLLEKEINRQKPGLSRIISSEIIKNHKKKIYLLLPAKFSLLDADLYVQKRWAAVNAIIVSGHFYDIDIHAIRKSLKDLLYNFSIFSEAEQQLLSQRVWKGKDDLYYKALLEELGSFQDQCTAIVLLNPFWLKKLSKKDRQPLEQVKLIWLENKIVMKQLLVKKLAALNIAPTTS